MRFQGVRLGGKLHASFYTQLNRAKRQAKLSHFSPILFYIKIDYDTPMPPDICILAIATG
jgi:hypothetical protein